MMKVVCFGEALVDMLQTGLDQVGPLSVPVIKQFPGGAPANVAVAIAKLGGDASFVGQVGRDSFGYYLKSALQSYDVGVEQLYMLQGGQTPIAFITLGEDGERSFDFYRTETADIVFKADQVPNSVFRSDCIFHFCSNTLTHRYNYQTTLELLVRAKLAGCMVSFDFNVRANLWSDSTLIRERIRACLAFTDIIKLSVEELDYVEPEGLDSLTKAAFEADVSLVLVTDGGKPVKFIAKEDDIFGEIEAPSVDVVDTTAAGDAFIGGFLYKLGQTKNAWNALGDANILMDAVEFAAQCGAFTVARAGAYTSLPSAKDMRLVK